MKKTFLIYALVCMALFGLTFQSCGDDDDDDKIEKVDANDTTLTNNGGDNPIVGTWKVVNVKLIVNGKSQSWDYDDFTYVVWKFTEDNGICTTYENGKAQYTTQGRYKLDGNQIVGLDHEDMSTMLYEFRGDTLVLENTSSEDYRQVFKCLPYGKEIDIVEVDPSEQLPVSYEEMAGTWTMTMAMYSGYDDASQNSIVLATANYYFTLTFGEGNSFEMILHMDGAETSGSGTYSITKSVLTLKFDNAEYADEVFTIFSFENNELILMKTNGSGTDMYSFDRTAK